MITRDIDGKTDEAHISTADSEARHVAGERRFNADGTPQTTTESGRGMHGTLCFGSTTPSRSRARTCSWGLDLVYTLSWAVATFLFGLTHGFNLQLRSSTIRQFLDKAPRHSVFLDGISTLLCGSAEQFDYLYFRAVPLDSRSGRHKRKDPGGVGAGWTERSHDKVDDIVLISVPCLDDGDDITSQNAPLSWNLVP